MSEELEVLKEIVLKLNAAEIPYMVSGSVAMNFYAQPRMTRDIDIVMFLKLNEVELFVSLFREGFYIEEDTIKEEVLRRGMFNLIHDKYIVKVDFIIKKEGVFDDVAFERRRQIEIDGVTMWIISPEDLVLFKLKWAKDSESEMQLKDVHNIVEMCKNLDIEYVEQWTRKLGLSNLLEKAKA